MAHIKWKDCHHARHCTRYFALLFNHDSEVVKQIHYSPHSTDKKMGFLGMSDRLKPTTN